MSILIFRFNVGLVAWCVQTVPPHGIDLWFWSLCVNVYFGGLGLTLKVLNLVVCVCASSQTSKSLKVVLGAASSGIKRPSDPVGPGSGGSRWLGFWEFMSGGTTYQT